MKDGLSGIYQGLQVFLPWRVHVSAVSSTLDVYCSGEWVHWLYYAQSMPWVDRSIWENNILNIFTDISATIVSCCPFYTWWDEGLVVFGSKHILALLNWETEWKHFPKWLTITVWCLIVAELITSLVEPLTSWKWMHMICLLHMTL